MYIEKSSLLRRGDLVQPEIHSRPMLSGADRQKPVQMTRKVLAVTFRIFCHSYIILLVLPPADQAGSGLYRHSLSKLMGRSVFSACWKLRGNEPPYFGTTHHFPTTLRCQGRILWKENCLGIILIFVKLVLLSE